MGLPLCTSIIYLFLILPCKCSVCRGQAFFLVCLIVEGQEWVVGISYRVSGGLSGQCYHWIIIGSAVLN